MLTERIQEPAVTETESAMQQVVTTQATQPAECGPVDLERAIKLALANNPELKAVREDAAIADKNIDVARSAFWPQVSASYGYIMLNEQLSIPLLGTLLDQDFHMAELKVQWMLCDFGRSLGRLEQARFGKNIADLQYRRFRQTIIFQAADAYFNVLRAQKAKKVVGDALASARAHLKTAEDLYGQEIAAKNDVLRAKVQVAEFEQQRITAVNAEKLTISVLNRVMGVNVNCPTQIVDIQDKPSFEGTLPAALQQAIDHRPEFEQVQSAIRFQEAGEDVARAEFYPEIYAAGLVIQVDGAELVDGTYSLGNVGIRMDLFTGGRRSARLQQAHSRIIKAVETAKAVSDGIALQVKQSYLGIDEARSRLAVAEAAVSSANENRRLVLEKYKYTLATATDVADAEATNTRAEQNYYSALYDFHFAIERLNFAIGINDLNDKR
jgi:outer membrane protein TolC